MSPIVNTVDFQQLRIVKTGRITLLLAVGFARVAIKELVLSGVPDCTPPGNWHERPLLTSNRRQQSSDS